MKTDEIVAPVTPEHVAGLANYYTNLSGVTDEQVVRCLAECAWASAAA